MKQKSHPPRPSTFVLACNFFAFVGFASVLVFGQVSGVRLFFTILLVGLQGAAFVAGLISRIRTA